MAAMAAALTMDQYLSFRGIYLAPPRTYRRPWEFLAAARGWREVLAASDAVKAYCAEKVMTWEAANLTEALALAARLVPDSTDGIESLLDPGKIIRKCGLSCIEGWDRHGRMVLVLSKDGRSYHFSGSAFGASHTFRDVYPWAVRAAIKAWRRQAEAEALEKDLLAKVHPADRCLLVWPEDSEAAGNCYAGTEAFARQHFPGRAFVPATGLIPHIQNPAVRRVLAYVGGR